MALRQQVRPDPRDCRPFGSLNHFRGIDRLPRSPKVCQRCANSRVPHEIRLFVQVGTRFRHSSGEGSATMVPTCNVQVRSGLRTYPTFPGMTL